MAGIRATLYIDTPPVCRWCCDRMEIDITSGDLSFKRILTRHAAVGLSLALRRELADVEGVPPIDLCRHLEAAAQRQ